MGNHTWNGHASFDKWRFERWEPVLQAGEMQKSAVIATNNGMIKLLSSEDIKIAQWITDMQTLDEKQRVVVEKIRTARSEIPRFEKTSDETVMSIINTLKWDSLHAKTFGNTIKSN
jgi:hypothetical protein